MSKVDRAIHGPGWGEVIFGAILSLVLGIAIGAVLLVVKPVVVAKEMPKEPVPGTVYFVEGLRGDSAKAKQALAKRKALIEGQSVKVTEDEVNALASAATVPEEKAGASLESVVTGTPNVRIRDGAMQVGVPVTLNVLGFQQKVIAQARGGFAKHGDVFAYDPDEIYVGSCPVQRLPFIAGYLKAKVLASQKVPDDIAAAWSKLTNVSIEGNTLNLAMQ